MNIGVDIDNVIANFDDELYREYLKHDKKLRNKGIMRQFDLFCVKKKIGYQLKEH